MFKLFHADEFIVFTTREFASRVGIWVSAATKRLSRLAEKEFLTRVTKGADWSDSRLPYLVASAEKLKFECLLDELTIPQRILSAMRSHLSQHHLKQALRANDRWFEPKE